MAGDERQSRGTGGARCILSRSEFLWISALLTPSPLLRSRSIALTGTDSATTTDVHLSRQVVRPDDLVVLTLDFVHLLPIDGSGAHDRKRLVRCTSQDVLDADRCDAAKVTGAFIVLRFPPQHIIEQDVSAGTTASGVAARIANESRVVLRVPDDIATSWANGLEYSLESVLGMAGRFPMNLAPAAKEFTCKDAQYFPAHLDAPPASTITAIEIPFRLVLSPNDKMILKHSPSVRSARDDVTTDGCLIQRPRPNTRTRELWTTSFVARSSTTEPTFRAIWTRDREAEIQTLDATLATSSSIAAVAQKALVLGSQGASLPAPYRKQVVDLTSQITQETCNDVIARPIRAEIFSLSALGAQIKLAYNTGEHIPSGYDLSSWAHETSLGRDNYVSYVIAGYLFPYGHRATVTDILERQQARNGTALLRRSTFIDVLEETRRLKSRTLPFQSVRLVTKRTPAVVRQPIRTKAGDTISLSAAFAPQIDAKDFLFKLEGIDYNGAPVRFTQPLVFISNAVIHPGRETKTITDGKKVSEVLQSVRDFYATVSTAPRFEARVFTKDEMVTVGDQVTLRAGTNGATQDEIVVYLGPALGNADQKIPTADDAFTFAQKRWHKITPTRRADFSISNQKIAFADSDNGSHTAGADSVTTLSTLKMSLDLGSAPISDEPSFEEYFAPSLKRAVIAVPAVADVLDQYIVSSIRIPSAFVTSGFTNSDVNPKEVFAIFDKPIDLDFGKANLKSGLAMPKSRIAALSRKTGVVLAASFDDNDVINPSFDPVSAFSIAELLPKVLGFIDLKDIISSAAIHDLSSPAVPKLKTQRIGDRLISSFSYASPLKSSGVFQAKNNCILRFDASVSKALTMRAQGERSLACSLTNFIVSIPPSTPMFDIGFTELSFAVKTGDPITFNPPKISSVNLRGNLQFLSELVKSFSKNSGPSIRIDSGAVFAGFAFSLPSIPLGVINIRNISIAAEVGIPLLDGKHVSVSFGFGSAKNPFLVSVGVFGGGGYFRLNTGTNSVEGALEFGGFAGLSIGGLATGNIYLLAGLRFELSRTGQSLRTMLTCGGCLRVLGIVSVSLTFYMELAYSTDKISGAKLSGTATLEIDISILFFSASVSLTVSREFVVSAAPTVGMVASLVSAIGPGSPGEAPAFKDLVSLAEWREYCEAFA